MLIAVTTTAAVAMEPGSNEAAVAVAITSGGAPVAPPTRQRLHGDARFARPWTPDEEQRLLHAQVMYPGYARQPIAALFLHLLPQ